VCASTTHGAALSQLLFLRQRVGDWHDLHDLRTQFTKTGRRRHTLLSPFVLRIPPTNRTLP
jgi:hypothetical protein